MELAPGFRRVGTGLVNVYLIEEAALGPLVAACKPGTPAPSPSGPPPLPAPSSS